MEVSKNEKKMMPEEYKCITKIIKIKLSLLRIVDKVTAGYLNNKEKRN